jgi:Caspase domain/Sel1 repeat
MSSFVRQTAKPLCLISVSLLVYGCASQAPVNATQETQERVRIAASNMQDAIVIDCQLPGKLIALGAQRQYLSPGQLKRLTAIDCRTRGGEYSLGDLSGGTLSLSRWLPLAQQGDPEAQYYVARIYANGMSGVPVDYAQAADWYAKAAKQKFAPAMQELGYLYESGLGVTQDRLLALNLQRQASGLGDELDYAWKLTATKEEAAQQSAALSQQLEASNAELSTLRSQLGQTRDGLVRSRNNLARAESAVITLGAQLKAQQSQGAGGAEKIKELEAKLSTQENELVAARTAADKLRSDLSVQQAELESRLQKSQATSLELNEVLATRQNEAISLRALLAQSEQRLLRSQQALSDLRLDYRRQVEQLAAERDEMDQARSKANNNDAAALLATKQHELDLQTLRAQALDSELGKLRAMQPEQVEAQNVALRAAIADLQAKYRDQLKQLQGAKDELAAIRAKTQSEQAALFVKMSDQLAVRAADLVVKQRRIESLEQDTTALKGELARLRDQQSKDHDVNMGESERARLALQAAEQKLSEQRDQLDKLKTEAATERAALIAERNALQQQMLEGQKASLRDIDALKLQIQARQAAISAKDEHIAALEKSLSEQTRVAVNLPLPTRDPYAHAAVKSSKVAMPAVSATYYALVIGNSNYRNMVMLATPTKDAQSVAALLEQQYAFQVKLLLDASSDQIMRSLDKYSIDLKENDRLLIYYAGHGGTRVGPPERAFWLGVDADEQTKAGWISAEDVGDKIKQIAARHVLLVSDSCFSASITHPTTTIIRRDLNEQRFQIQWNRRARMVLTSGQNSPVVDVSEDGNHSLFARSFLAVLRQNNDVMSGEMLSYELGSRMQPEAARMGLTQIPTYTSLQDSNHDYGDFFFLPAANQERVAAL